MTQLNRDINSTIKQFRDVYGHESSVLWNNQMNIEPKKRNIIRLTGVKDTKENLLLDKERGKFNNFAMFPYYKDGIDGEAMMDLELLQKIKNTNIQKGHSSGLSNLKDLFSNFKLDRKHLNVLKKYYENDEYEGFETYLSLMLLEHKNSTYIRDVIYDTFPEVHEKRQKYYKDNIDYYRNLSKLAIRQIPRDQKDFIMSYFLSLGTPTNENEQNNLLKDKNGGFKNMKDVRGKLDNKLMKEFLFRGETKNGDIRNRDIDKIDGDYIVLKSSRFNADDDLIFRPFETPERDGEELLTYGDVPKQYFSSNYTPKFNEMSNKIFMKSAYAEPHLMKLNVIKKNFMGEQNTNRWFNRFI